MIRHAQSVWNAAGLWQGHADPSLSAEGRSQAAAAGSRLEGLEFDAVFTSDLTRTVETAEILIASFLPRPAMIVDPGLREYDVGEWSGRLREDIESLWPGDIKRFATGELSSPPGGEDRAGFDSRVLSAAGRVARCAADAGWQSILVVAHGGVVRTLARLCGVTEYRVGHLAGYRGRHADGGLFPEEPVDLLELEMAPGST